MPAERRRSPTPRGLAGARVAALAGEQRGAISRTQLVALGLSTTTVDRRVDDGTLKPLWPGVYAHGHAALTRDGWLMASVLACGEGAHLAARAAAAARGLMAAWSTTDEGIVFRSRPERLARDLIRAAGLLEPRVNAWFPTRAGHGYELDLWWPGLSLDFEIDGPQHRLPHQRRKDAERDADLRSFGVTVTRVPDTLVVERPERFLVAVRDALERR